MMYCDVQPRGDCRKKSAALCALLLPYPADVRHGATNANRSCAIVDAWQVEDGEGAETEGKEGGRDGKKEEGEETRDDGDDEGDEGDEGDKDDDDDHRR